MINNTPWLWNGRKTAAGMTARTSNGIRILQGRRARGQSNPSQQYLDSQVAAQVIWPIFRAAQGIIRSLWTNVQTGRYAANEFYKKTYDNAITFPAPLTPVVSYPDLQFTNGVMTPTGFLTLVADVSLNTVVAAYSALPSDASQLTTDVLWYVIHNRTADKWVSGASATRGDASTGGIVATNLTMTAGDTLDFYGGFQGDVGTLNAGSVSPSTFITTTVIA